jgi:hypothetical protein
MRKSTLGSEGGHVDDPTAVGAPTEGAADIEALLFKRSLKMLKRAAILGNKKALVSKANEGEKKNLAATYSTILLRTVPSAMKGLTAEFGMGSGISPSL